MVGSEGAIEWLDFNFDRSRKGHDSEIKGLEFLPADSVARRDWPTFWPQRGNVMNWDAIGRMKIDGVDEWLLVEAKAHVEELRSDCLASAEGGLGKILASLETVKQALGIVQADWRRGYYQMCNRLAVLQFLAERHVQARLVLIYFCGDSFPDNKGFFCPASRDGWVAALAEQDRHIGIPEDHAVRARIYKVFLEVGPQ
jgi:hypothetical protein